MLKKSLCIIFCIFFISNMIVINSSNESNAKNSPQAFGAPPGVTYKTGDWEIFNNTTYDNSIIDLTGNLIIHEGATLTLNDTILRMNITSETQDFGITVEDTGGIHILSNSRITDSILDVDTGTGKDEDSDYRYTIYVESGTFICANSTIEEVGTYGVYDTFKIDGGEDNFLMENSTLQYSYDGLRLYDTKNFEIKYCEFKNIHHLAVYGNGIENSKIIKNEVYNLSVHGFYMTYGSNNLIKGCNIDKIGSHYGIYWSYGTDNIIEECNISNVGSRGIYMQYGSNNFVNKCDIKNIGGHGVDVEHAYDMRIENNTIEDIGSYGMDLYPNRKVCYVKNNYINHTGSYGIYIYRPIDSEVYNNRINGSYEGFYFNYAERTKVSNNKITNTTYIAIRTYYSKDMVFTNNYINYTQSGYGFYSYSYSSYQRMTLINNTFIDIYRGLYFDSYYYITLKNNKISGRSIDYGIRAYYCYYMALENNKIEKFDYGLYLYYTSYNSNDVIDVYGGSIANIDYNDLYIYGRTYLRLYNVSLDLSQIYFPTSSYSPYAKIYYNVDVLVEDTEGPVGGAKVTVKDQSGGGLNPIEATTDLSGWARSITVLNRIRYYSSTTYYNAYNFSADVSGKIANASQANYDINSYKTLTITYNIDTPPTPPVDLRIEVEYDTIVLKWECYVTDLESFKVFRKDAGGGWVLVDKESFVKPGLTKSWSDEGRADQLTEFRYKIHHIDSSLYEEQNDDWVIFTDWVITDYKSISNADLVLNGSLIIEDGGYLNLRNTSVLMNGTSYDPGIKAVEVREGGRLVIKDVDDDSSTGSDKSFINASEAADHYEFIVLPGGRLEIYNSWIQNSSYNTPYGDVNIFVNSDNCTVMNSTIVTTSRAVYLEQAENCVIDGNMIQKEHEGVYYQYGVYVSESDDILIANNSIINASFSCIELLESNNIQIINNSILTEESEKYRQNGITITYSENILIAENKFNDNYHAVLIEGGNVILINNNITNCTLKAVNATDTKNLIMDNNWISMLDMFGYTTGIDIEFCEVLDISNNTVAGFQLGRSNTYGIKIEDFYYMMLAGNKIYNSQLGIRIENSWDHEQEDAVISGNIIHDMDMGGGIGFELVSASNMIFLNNTIYKTYYGIHQLDTREIIYWGDELSDITYGYFLKSSSEATLINVTIYGDPSCTVYLNTSSEVSIISADFNLTTISVSDKTCEARIYWGVDVRIKDHFGNHIPNIFLRVRLILGTIVFEGLSNADGYYWDIIILERVQYYDENISYTPASFEAEYANHTAYASITIDAKQTIDLQLGNTAPNVYNIFIAPQRPITIDELILQQTYTYVDNENDQENGTTFKWFRNDEHVPELDNLTTVPSNYTNKSDRWRCEVTPCDSRDHGTPGNSITVLIFNSIPVASNVSLTPDNPDGKQDLIVSYNYFDIDGDSELGTLFYWYARSVTTNFSLRATTSFPQLSSLYTTEGEDWYVEIEPKDGEDSGLSNASNIIHVGNTIPTIENLRIIPDDPTANEDLTVNYKFVDVDGDSEGATRFRWLKDDGIGFGLLESGIMTRTVPLKFLEKSHLWMCQVTPHDGNVYGEIYNSSIVKIGNTAPVISNIEILPKDPDTTDDLTVNYAFYDRDLDPEQDTLYEWFRMDGDELVKTGVMVKTIPSFLTNKDEIWICEVIPSDGYSQGQLVTTAPILVKNHIPDALELKILPEDPQTLDDLTALYSYSDFDEDLENGTEIKWYRNGQHESLYDNDIVIPFTSTQKGEYWYFTVAPGDGNVSNVLYTSAMAQITNTPPTILTAAIDPDTPFSSDDLDVDFDVYDPDPGDSSESIDITWYQNGIETPQYKDYQKISAGATLKGQSWKYVIRISDGEDYGEEVESSSIDIWNSKPVITSFYPQENNLTIRESEMLSFAIEAVDPDPGDLIIKQWFWGDKIVGDKLNYDLITDFESAGKKTLTIKIQDYGTGSVEVSHTWNVDVKNYNRPPIIHVDEPLDPNPYIANDRSQRFHITFTELDKEDTPKITWYLNGVDKGEESTYILNPNDVGIGKHVVLVEVTDESKSKSTYRWNVTVHEVEQIQEIFFGLNWDQWSIVLEAIVIGATGMVAFSGFLRLRRRKGALQHYMREIEMLMLDWISNPEATEKSLVELSVKVENDFGMGRIEDFHYFLLDRQIKESLREIRQTKIKDEFAFLPENLRRELNVILEEGRVTDKVYKNFVSFLQEHEEIHERDKERLRSLMRNWKAADTKEAPKKIKIKAISIQRKKKGTRFGAGALGWEDLSQQKEKQVKFDAQQVGWQEVPRGDAKPVKMGAAQAGWQDVAKKVQAPEKPYTAGPDRVDREARLRQMRERPKFSTDQLHWMDVSKMARKNKYYSDRPDVYYLPDRIRYDRRGVRPDES